MSKQSAGILLYRMYDTQLQVFLVHPGGPYFVKKDDGSWSIPKGEFESGEDPQAAAKREFEEETGHPLDGNFIKLQPVKQKSGKTVYTWAVEGDINHTQIVSNLFEMEWPPRSGKKQSFPEIDRAEWFDIETAKAKIIPGQSPLLDELQTIV